MNPHYYCVQIASNHPISSTPVIMAAKSMIMEPTNSENLDRFLTDYQRFGTYYLLPAAVKPAPEFFHDLRITKRKLRIISATEVSDQDIESLALRTHRLKLPH
jgi:hypothetical protein